VAQKQALSVGNVEEVLPQANVTANTWHSDSHSL